MITIMPPKPPRARPASTPQRGQPRQSCQRSGAARRPPSDTTTSATTSRSPASPPAPARVLPPAPARVLPLPVDAAGDYILFFSSDVQVGVFAADGTEVPLEATMQPIEECPATVAKGLTYPLAVGTYTISISSSTEAAVSLVVEPAGADDHQH
jgi:hypothetical protein